MVSFTRVLILAPLLGNGACTGGSSTSGPDGGATRSSSPSTAAVASGTAGGTVEEPVEERRPDTRTYGVPPVLEDACANPELPLSRFRGTLPPGPPGPPVLLTPCVQPRPPADAYQVEGRPRGPMRTHAPLDLDGDGTKDLFVTSGKFEDYSGGYTFAVYVMRGDCGHFVGTVQAYDMDAFKLQTVSHGLADLEVKTGGIYGWEYVHYRFNGLVYVGVEQKGCHHGPTEGAEPECYAWRDLGGIPMPPEGWPSNPICKTY
jgi:hypothetical protein